MVLPTTKGQLMHIINAVAEGLHDHELDQIILACKARAKHVPLQVGDTIQVNDECSPQYMRGVKCTIVKKLTGKYQFLCKPLDTEASKLAGTKMVTYDWATQTYKVREIKMPRSLIMKVDTDA